MSWMAEVVIAMEGEETVYPCAEGSECEAYDPGADYSARGMGSDGGSDLGVLRKRER